MIAEPKIEQKSQSPKTEVQKRTSSTEERFKKASEILKQKANRIKDSVQGIFKKHPEIDFSTEQGDFSSLSDEFFTKEARTKEKLGIESETNQNKDLISNGETSTEPVETKTKEEKAELPSYISETMQRVRKNSPNELEDFVSCDQIKSDIQSSFYETIQVEVAAKHLPTKQREEIITLMPTSADRARAKIKMEFASWHITDMGDSTKDEQRRQLIEKAKGIADYWEDGKFTKEVSEITQRQQQEAIEKGKQAIESTNDEGVFIINVSPENLLPIIEAGKYQPKLDQVGTQSSFSSFFKIRYDRELELGTYPPNGEANNIPHPVYGQIVVDEKNELLRAVQEGYGTTHIKLKTNRVKNRTMFIVDDSVSAKAIYNQQLAWEDAAKGRVFLNALMDNPKADWRSLPSYIEGQVMGGVTTNDIDEIVFQSGTETKSLEDYIRKNSSRFIVIKDDKNNQTTVKLKEAEDSI